MVSFSSLATLQISTKILSDIPGTHFFFFFKFMQLSFQENTEKERFFLLEGNFISLLMLLVNQLPIAQLTQVYYTNIRK